MSRPRAWSRPSWVWLPTGLVAALALALAAVVTLAGPTPVACAGSGTPSFALRFLVVSPGATDATTAYWRDALGRAGVPYDVRGTSEGPPLEGGDLVHGLKGRYQAVVVAGAALESLSPEERAVLDEYERRFGVRRISAFPGVPPAELRGQGVDPLRGTSWLTGAGRRAFPDLRGPVPVAGAQALGTAAVEPDRLTVLLRTKTTPLLVEVRHADGREELVDTMLQDSGSLHSQLLAPGLISWASRGVHLGMWRHHLSVQVDDVLLASFLWDTRANRPGRASRVITTPTDLDRAAGWSRRTGLRLDLGINASGAESYGGDCTELGQAVIAHRSDFGFFNHTYRHLNLDDAPGSTIVDEIVRNAGWAWRNGIPLDPAVVVTGEHSGLRNAELPAALDAAEVRWIASDAADTTEAGRRGPATTVPRYPSNIYFDVASRAELLDQYNYTNFESCTVAGTCLERPATWEGLVRDETATLVRRVLGNDPRPLFVHQNNLAAEGTLYPFLDSVLRVYRRSVRAPLLQPTLDETGRELLRRRRFPRAGEGLVAWRTGDRVFLRSRRATEVPLTGFGAGDEYAGRRSGWVALEGGVTMVLPVG